jgi:excinuclease ABC subunit A
MSKTDSNIKENKSKPTPRKKAPAKTAAPLEDNELTTISVRGAREHNLKSINVDIPRDKLVVITGLSGSGKSSLAFDTLYAEGQRRYIECLSSYARQFLGMMKKPEVDRIEGLSPAISIEQKSISHNPRSTVGTVTEIYDYLRLLFAKIGVQYCVDCHIPVEQKSLDQIVEDIFERFAGKRLMLLAPLIRGRKGHYRELFDSLIKQGFTKVRIDGKLTPLEPEMQVSRYATHNIELLVDRFVPSQQQEHRIVESLELALQKADGSIIILSENENGEYAETLYSTEYSCPSCGKSYQTLAPNSFSFNSPYGACKTCDGLGEKKDFHYNVIVPDKSISINNGGIAPLGKPRSSWLWEQIKAYLDFHKLDADVPIKDLPEDLFENLIWGHEPEIIPVTYKFSGGKNVTYQQKFAGLVPTLKHQYDNSTSNSVRSTVEEFMSVETCPDCHGGRLKQESLAVFINGSNIDDFVRLDIAQARERFAELEQRLGARQLTIANLIIKEIRARLNFLVDVGLSYLTLNRSIRTLSGGESQRIRLAAQIGTELVGIMYVLDEPSIGLHQHDNDKLIASLKRLRDLGNTVIVVEHDKAMMLESDHIIDLGPGAGINGGEVIVSVQSDSFKKLSKSELKNSLTFQYLNNIKQIDTPKERRQGNGKRIILEGATGNNLKNVTLEIPLGLSICITGKSGSGKSSLINDTLYPILSNKFYRSTQIPLPYKSISGLEYIDKVIEIDQSPIGRTPRSNPVTYTGIFTQIRDFYAMLPESRVRGYKSGRFSFNVKGGRCEECEGAGIKKIEMNFLPEVYVTCDECNGKRYNKETLSVLYKGKSIADVLAMTVEEAVSFFNEIPRIKSKLQTLNEVGLSYITLGQQAPTLSGGEAQRVKLAAELSKMATGKTLYLLDEPTTGLHFEDIRILLKLLDKLVEKGNTVIIIEHNLDVIKCADWVIDLGPEGGAAGGEIIAVGTPEDVAKNKKSYTGRYLKKEL